MLNLLGRRWYIKIPKKCDYEWDVAFKVMFESESV